MDVRIPRCIEYFLYFSINDSLLKAIPAIKNGIKKNILDTLAQVPTLPSNPIISDAASDNINARL